MKQVDTIVLVKDIKRISSFYIDLFGLEILHDWDSMIIFKNRLSFHQIDKLEPKSFSDKLHSGTGGVIIYLELDPGVDLEGILNKLENNGIEIIHGIYKLPWQRIIRVYDPEGNIVEIGEPSLG